MGPSLNEGYIELITWREISLIYSISHNVNSSLSIQLWQSVTCPALRRKRVLRIVSVLHQKKKSWIWITELITRHAETCKQVIIMKRIKKQTNKKNKHNNFLKEEMLPSFFHRNCCKSKCYSWYFHACRINKWHRLENRRIQRITV